MITRTSGKYGVLLWINAYLEKVGQTLDGRKRTRQSRKIDRWVEAQYAGDREETITEAEMLAQVKIHLNGEI